MGHCPGHHQHRCDEPHVEGDDSPSHEPVSMAEAGINHQVTHGCCALDIPVDDEKAMNLNERSVSSNGCGDSCCEDETPNMLCADREHCDNDNISLCCGSSETACSSTVDQDLRGNTKSSCCEERRTDTYMQDDHRDCSAGVDSHEDCCLEEQTTLSNASGKPPASKTTECCKPERGDCCTGNMSSTKCTNLAMKADCGSVAGKGFCAGHLEKVVHDCVAYVNLGKCICKNVLQKHVLSDCCGKVSRRDRHHHHSARPSTGHCHDDTRVRSSHKSDKNRTRSKCCTTDRSERCQEGKASLHCSSNEIATIPVSEKSEMMKAKCSDIEHDAAREHVVLNVTGMTCSGCGRKAENVLKRIEGVGSIKVTFVSSIAEFDINPKLTTSEKVMNQLQRETGFKCSSIISNHQALEVLMNETVAMHFSQSVSKGVESVEKVSKGRYRVIYDPTIIGARDLMAQSKEGRLAPVSNDAAMVESKRKLVRTGWAVIFAAVLTIPICVLAWANTDLNENTSLIILIILATLVQCIAIPEFYMGAIKALVFSKVMETDMLVVISITAAYGYSLVASALTLAGHTLEVGAFFETSSLLITLVLIGRLMATMARVKAVSAVSLRSLQSETAIIIEPTGDTLEIDARLLQFGDTFVIRPHTQVVTDGEIIDGESSVDESMVTGESVPVRKIAGDMVIAGTINGPSALSVRLTRLPGKNSITDIAGLVETALSNKPRLQDLADRFASWFIPVVMCVATAVLIVWLVVALKVRHKNGGGAFGTAITYSIAVLAITCPCALGLAVPMVLVIASGVAARRGIVIKNAPAIEAAYKTTDVVFDKTGTLTIGDMHVCHQQTFRDETISSEEVLSLAEVLTNGSEHPVSKAVNAAISGHRGGKPAVQQMHSLPGAGVECIWDGKVVKAGNPYWLEIDHHPDVSSLIEKGVTLFGLTLGSRLLAVWGLKATVRDEAVQIIRDLQKQGVRCHIVSGDLSTVVQNLAAELDVPAEQVASRQSPADKQRYVKSLMMAGRRVLFCGDGTNDAVAVAEADVGVQIGSASDVTRATADVILLGNLDGIPTLLSLSKQAVVRIRFNFAWSAIYNVVAILFAAGAFVKVRIPPAYAGLGEIVSVAPVIVVAMSLSVMKLST